MKMNVKGEARNTEKNMNMENDFSEPRSGFSFPAMELFDDKDYESEEELAWSEGFRIDDDGHWVPLENRYEYFDLFCDDGYSDDCFDNPDEEYSEYSGGRISRHAPSQEELL